MSKTFQRSWCLLLDVTNFWMSPYPANANQSRIQLFDTASFEWRDRLHVCGPGIGVCGSSHWKWGKDYSWFKNLFQSDLDNFCDRFKTTTASDYLSKTFIATREDSPFAKSGITAYKLVCAYMWINKWYVISSLSSTSSLSSKKNVCHTQS